MSTFPNDQTSTTTPFRSSSDPHGVTSASVPAPLPAAEIESLLRSAQRRFEQPSQPESQEDLGPGDVQHLRGDSHRQIDVPIISESLQISRQDTERRVAELLLDSNQGRVTTETSSHETVTPYNHSRGLTLDDLGDVDLDISIEIGRTEILIEDILKLREGSVVTLDRTAGDPVDIVANGRLVARGELLVIDGKFGVRLSEVL